MTKRSKTTKGTCTIVVSNFL